MSKKTDADISLMARRFVERKAEAYWDFFDRSIRLWAAKNMSDAWEDGYRRALRDHGLGHGPDREPGKRRVGRE